MKKLTLNRIAGAGIRANRKSYLSLCAGIFASVFLVCAVIMSLFAAYAGYREKIDQQSGRQDAILFGAAQSDAELLRKTDLVKETGFATIVAECEGFGVGFYDEAGEQLAYRQMFSGRMPEAPGEIAMDMDALEMLLPNAEPGDVIHLTVTPIDGEPEDRDFLLTGIVRPQKGVGREMFADAYGTNFGWEDAYTIQIYLFSEDAVFASGRQFQNLYLSLGRNVALKTISEAIGDRLMIGVDIYGYAYGPDLFVKDDTPLLSILMGTSAFSIIMLLGGSLLFFALFGVASALDSQLERKKEEIGMLRAVGATRRQIRQIFGRESILLALLLAPAAVAASAAFTYGMSLWAPKTFRFYLPPVALALMLLCAILMVMGASFLPLWRSAKQEPMGVIRDTAVLRKAKRLRSKSSFRPSGLVTLRKLRLYPMRCVSGGILTVVLCAAFFISAILAEQAINVFSTQQYMEDFSIYRNGWLMFGDFRSDISEIQLSDADIDQLRAIPHVKKVNPQWKTMVILHTEKEIDYLEQCKKGNTIWWFNLDGPAYDAAQKRLQVEGNLTFLELLVIENPEELSEYLSSGSINRDALDAGQEILLCAPEYYVTDMGDYYYTRVQEPANGAYDFRIKNTELEAGQELELFQMTGDPKRPQDDEADACINYLALYQQAELHRAETRIGGVLVALNGDRRNGKLSNSNVMLVTTPQGLKNLGLLHSEVSAVGIMLDGDVDIETEQDIESRIQRIISRGDGLGITNWVKMNRENRQTSQIAAMVCTCVVTLFLLVSVSIIAGNCVRQMQSEKKAIGTLRVLGMNGKELVNAYSGQAAASILVGFLLSLIVDVFFLQIWRPTPLAIWLGIPGQGVICLLAVLLCRVKVGSAAKALLASSIIDNIREV